jgi:vacuolar protein sorting-associated protein 45
MEEGHVAPEKVALVDAMLRYAGKEKRGPGLYGDGGLMSKMAKSLKTSLEGIENVYSQHVPLLMHTLDAVRQGKLKDSVFPAIAGGGGAGRPQEVIVFIVGGVTFEEAYKVAELNASNCGISALLGGSFIHNSTSFLEDLHDAFSR